MFSRVLIASASLAGVMAHSHGHQHSLDHTAAAAHRLLEESGDHECFSSIMASKFPPSFLNQAAKQEEERLELYKEKEARKKECERTGECRVLPNEKFTIPIAWHVVYPTEEVNAYVTDELLEANRAQLDLDFNMQNPDGLTGTPDMFQQFRGEAGIRFTTHSIQRYRAPTPPTGWATYDRLVPGSFEKMFALEKVLKFEICNPADQATHMNVYIAEWDTTLKLLGYAYGPGIGSYQMPVVGGALQWMDGVALQIHSLGSIANPGTMPGYQGLMGTNKGRTATHEIGHYLGLAHPFDNQVDPQFCGDDKLADTPQTKANRGCPTHPTKMQCDREDPDRDYPVMFMNFMDYVDDTCMVMFSTDQVTKMRSALDRETGLRNKLGSNSYEGEAPTPVGSAPTAPTAPSAPTKQPTVAPTAGRRPYYFWWFQVPNPPGIFLLTSEFVDPQLAADPEGFGLSGDEAIFPRPIPDLLDLDGMAGARLVWDKKCYTMCERERHIDPNNRDLYKGGGKTPIDARLVTEFNDCWGYGFEPEKFGLNAQDDFMAYLAHYKAAMDCVVLGYKLEPNLETGEAMTLSTTWEGPAHFKWFWSGNSVKDVDYWGVWVDGQPILTETGKEMASVVNTLDPNNSGPASIDWYNYEEVAMRVEGEGKHTIEFKFVAASATERGGDENCSMKDEYGWPACGYLTASNGGCQQKALEIGIKRAPAKCNPDDGSLDALSYEDSMGCYAFWCAPHAKQKLSLDHRLVLDKMEVVFGEAALSSELKTGRFPAKVVYTDSPTMTPTVYVASTDTPTVPPSPTPPTMEPTEFPTTPGDTLSPTYAWEAPDADADAGLQADGSDPVSEDYMDDWTDKQWSDWVDTLGSARTATTGGDDANPNDSPNDSSSEDDNTLSANAGGGAETGEEGSDFPLVPVVVAAIIVAVIVALICVCSRKERKDAKTNPAESAEATKAHTSI